MKLRHMIRAAWARCAGPFTFTVRGMTTTATARRMPPVRVACILAPVPRSTRTTPARPALTATAGRVAVPFTFAALLGRVISKPAPPTARRAPPTSAATQAARTTAHRAGFDAGRAAERLRLASIPTVPAARWHPDLARADLKAGTCPLPDVITGCVHACPGAPDDGQGLHLT